MVYYNVTIMIIWFSQGSDCFMVRSKGRHNGSPDGEKIWLVINFSSCIWSELFWELEPSTKRKMMIGLIYRNIFTTFQQVGNTTFTGDQRISVQLGNPTNWALVIKKVLIVIIIIFIISFHDHALTTNLVLIIRSFISPTNLSSDQLISEFFWAAVQLKMLPRQLIFHQISNHLPLHPDDCLLQVQPLDAGRYLCTLETFPKQSLVFLLQVNGKNRIYPIGELLSHLAIWHYMDFDCSHLH